MKNKPLDKKILCYFCHKPIKTKDLGGIVSIGGKDAWFHKWLPCLIEFVDSTHKGKGGRKMTYTIYWIKKVVNAIRLAITTFLFNLIND